MAKKGFINPTRTLNYHMAMRVFPPVPVRLEVTVQDVIRLAKAGRNDATVCWYGKTTPVSQVVAEFNLSEFVEHGVWVTQNGSHPPDFVLPQADGSIFDVDTTLVKEAR